MKEKINKKDSNEAGGIAKMMRVGLKSKVNVKK